MKQQDAWKFCTGGHIRQPRSLVGCYRLGATRLQQFAVLIAPDRDKLVPHQQSRRTVRVQRAKQVVAKVDHGPDAATLDVGQNRLQRPAIAVNVRDRREAIRHANAPRH